MNPYDEPLNPYQAPESAQEPAADQIQDFASRKRRKLIQILFVTAFFEFLAGLLPEDSSINRVKELLSSSKGKNHSSIGPTGLVPCHYPHFL